MVEFEIILPLFTLTFILLYFLLQPYLKINSKIKKQILKSPIKHAPLIKFLNPFHITVQQIHNDELLVLLSNKAKCFVGIYWNVEILGFLEVVHKPWPEILSFQTLHKLIGRFSDSFEFHAIDEVCKKKKIIFIIPQMNIKISQFGYMDHYPAVILAMLTNEDLNTDNICLLLSVVHLTTEYLSSQSLIITQIVRQPYLMPFYLKKMYTTAEFGCSTEITSTNNELNKISSLKYNIENYRHKEKKTSKFISELEISNHLIKTDEACSKQFNSKISSSMKIPINLNYQQNTEKLNFSDSDLEEFHSLESSSINRLNLERCNEMKSKYIVSDEPNPHCLSFNEPSSIYLSATKDAKISNDKRQDVKSLENEIMKDASNEFSSNVTSYSVDEIDESRLCSVCATNTVCNIILPCRHVCTCDICSNRLAYCPICRTLISYRVSIKLD